MLPVLLQGEETLLRGIHTMVSMNNALYFCPEAYRICLFCMAPDKWHFCSVCECTGVSVSPPLDQFHVYFLCFLIRFGSFSEIHNQWHISCPNRLLKWKVTFISSGGATFWRFKNKSTVSTHLCYFSFLVGDLGKITPSTALWGFWLPLCFEWWLSHISHVLTLFSFMRIFSQQLWWPEPFFLDGFPSSLHIKLYALLFHVTSSVCSGNRIHRSFSNIAFMLSFLLAVLSRAQLIAIFKQELLCNFISDLTLLPHHLETKCVNFGISISFKAKLKIFNWY